jgi:hypothetical protein
VAGDAFLVPTANGVNHVHFVLCQPTTLPNAGSHLHVILVNLTSVPANPQLPYDQTCVVKKGDHPFVLHDSFVAYRYMRTDTMPHFQNLLISGYIKPHTNPASTVLLNRMVAGVCISKLVPREYKKIFGCII